jgi:hypothetical protein
LSKRLDAFAETLNAGSYRVPGASARRAGLYLVPPPEEA